MDLRRRSGTNGDEVEDLRRGKEDWMCCCCCCCCGEVGVVRGAVDIKLVCGLVGRYIERAFGLEGMDLDGWRGLAWSQRGDPVDHLFGMILQSLIGSQHSEKVTLPFDCPRTDVDELTLCI